MRRGVAPRHQTFQVSPWSEALPDGIWTTVASRIDGIRARGAPACPARPGLALFHLALLSAGWPTSHPQPVLVLGVWIVRSVSFYYLALLKFMRNVDRYSRSMCMHVVSSCMAQPQSLSPSLYSAQAGRRLVATCAAPIRVPGRCRICLADTPRPPSGPSMYIGAMTAHVHGPLSTPAPGRQSPASRWQTSCRNPH